MACSWRRDAFRFPIPSLPRGCFTPFIEREMLVKEEGFYASLLPYFSRVICGGLIYKFNEGGGRACKVPPLCCTELIRKICSSRSFQIFDCPLCCRFFIIEESVQKVTSIDESRGVSSEEKKINLLRNLLQKGKGEVDARYVINRRSKFCSLFHRRTQRQRRGGGPRRFFQFNEARVSPSFWKSHSRNGVGRRRILDSNVS